MPAGCCARPPTRRPASPATRSPTSSTSPSAPTGSRPHSTFPIRRIESRWAGLRCFAADKTPVAGFDPRAAGFFWLAGQGGYGIQTAPALAALAAAQICGEPIPDGLDPAPLSPDRLLTGLI